MADNPRRSNLLHFLMMGILLAACIGLEYYFHFLLGIHIVYTHLFYIPIVSAALWWGLKGGLPAGLFLAFLHVVPYLPEAELSILIRALMFILVGSVIGIVSDMRKRTEEELHARKEAETIFLGSGDGMRTIDTNYKITNLNEEMGRLCGLNKAEALGKKCDEPCHTPSCNTDECPLRQILSGANRVEIETELTSAKGNITPVSLMATALEDEEGKVVGIIESFRDITERKKAEEERRVLYEAISSSSEGTALADTQDRYIYVNEAHARMHGYMREELLGRTWRDITPPEYVERSDKEIVPVLMKTGKWESEFVALRKNGETFPIWLSITALFDEERNYAGHICAVRDITERKRAEKTLRESEEKYRNLIERANDGIVIVQDTLLKYVNPRLAEIIGYTVEELTNTPFSDYIHPDELPKVADRYKRRMAGEDVIPIYETAIKHKNGSDINAEFNAGMVIYQGRPANLVFVRDITERKQVEEEIKQRTEDLSLVNSLNSAVNRGESLQGIIDLLSRKTGEMFSGYGATVYFLSEDRKYLILQKRFIPPVERSRVKRTIGTKIPELEIKIPLKEGGLYWKILQGVNYSS